MGEARRPAGAETGEGAWGATAFREAGPPTAWLTVAVLASVAVASPLLIAASDVARDWRAIAVIPIVATTLVGVLDRDGWRIRAASEWLDLMQRERWGSRPVPASRWEALGWLDDPRNADAPRLDRAAILMLAERPAEARAVLEEGPEADDAAELSRLRGLALLDAGDDGPWEPSGFDDLLDRAAITPDERRYQLVSVAWSRLLVDIEARRPWRSAFARSIRGLGPFPVPWPVTVRIAVQQLLFPIVMAAALVVLTILPT